MIPLSLIISAKGLNPFADSLGGKNCFFVLPADDVGRGEPSFVFFPL